MVAVLVMVACGDPDTRDERGYTKAPLERPMVLVQGETVSEMDALANPAMPEAPLIEAEPDTAKPTTGTTGGPPAAGPAQGTAPAGATAADVTEGQKIFSATGNCFTCHGPDGSGSALAPSLKDAQWLNISGDFASIQQIVNNGVPNRTFGPSPVRRKPCPS